MMGALPVKRKRQIQGTEETETHLARPSKEVAKIFDGATKTGILDRSRSTGHQPQKQGLPTWSLDRVPEEKDLCYKSRYQGEKNHNGT
ncbi:hypothetical protein C2G38_2229058 [Gigaspora rosea]|uniref:Uncharacterized protein n=1 Tax=Gigaspora rosea TaxID=44941 RepID=A0A397TV57_9GLOM|nr:hypothetical protein C2G38_2229058 [Gigaspora rosea]